MPSVMLIQGGGLPRVDSEGRGELSTLSWLVTDMDASANPFDLPEIPRRGEARVIHGIRYVCDEVSVEQQINSDDLVVSARFSTDSRFSQPKNVNPPEINADHKNWTFGYKKVPFKPPVFVLGKHYYTDADGNRTSKDWWLRDELYDEVQVEFSVLNVSVVLRDLTNQDMISVIRKTRAQVGVMHIFPSMPEFYWLFQPPRIINPEVGMLRIDYAWESDPGNSSPELLDSSRYVVPPYRPSFYAYTINPAQQEGGRPLVGVVDTYPLRVISSYDDSGNPTYVSNPYYQPNGWANLPGSPI